MTSLSKKHLLITAALLLGVSAPAFATVGNYNTPNGAPDGKLTVVVPENQVIIVPERELPAQQDRVKGPTELLNPGNIRFLSGGVGHDEQQRLAAAESDYPLKVTFARADGSFVSDVRVAFADEKGNEVLQIVTDGPILLVDLKPGAYTITATDGADTKEQKFTLGKKHAFAIHF